MKTAAELMKSDKPIHIRARLEFGFRTDAAHLKESEQDPQHHETRRFHRPLPIGWLRAAVLGASGGIVFTGGLIVGVSAAEASRSSVLAGMDGLGRERCRRRPAKMFPAMNSASPTR